MIRFALSAAAAAVLGLLSTAPVHAIEIEQVKSPGGIEAWLVEEPSIPFTALEIRFRGGTVLDRPGKRGAVNLMTGLLEEGAGDRDAQAFALARESLAASFAFDAYDDAVSISARFLTENRDRAVALLRDALVAPRFEQDAIDRVRDQVLSIIATDSTDPGAIARRSFDAAAFAGHPYATPKDGTAETVGALTREDIVQAHADTLVRDRVFVGAVGDITPDELGLLLDNLLGDLPQSGAPLPGDAGYALEGGVNVVPLDTPQSTILFGHEGIERDDPDFFAAYVVNQIFGGSGFESRLMQEVREKRGLTYGIGTYLAPMLNGELLMGSAATANARVGETIEVIRDEWAAIAQGVTQEELDAAKTFLTGAYPLRFDGNATIAGIMVGMQMEGLPPEYITSRNEMVEAVTLDDARRVAERIFHPEDLHFTVVGQSEGLPGQE
ncbi:M16 family metallopeptidase [Profundibacterium mesophilum]|uniref:Zinc protease n=1 Tax=Profundibacterium mesophilum KAUST100406-0324 TaxID=1037889 RepID=A0A921NTY3_9RHOB|nr:pitrilysin family protein [Profundibacterium mesophilum]KAF0676579.1 putative zinc protease [Profundibacterium mesophilum KAUST100406-0324]